MRPPAFWRHDGLIAHGLTPVAGLVARATARRMARPGWRAPVPVLCCGNVTVGGAGKTTLALDLGVRLLRRGARVAFLTRGYGGQVRGVASVQPGDTAAMVGDEALLLAAVAPTWVAPDRAAAARAAVAAGATVLVMDDGLQHPGLVQDLALLVVDGTAGFGNGRVLPAGPLREPVAAGAARCRAAVLIGGDEAGAAAMLPAALPVLRATLRPEVGLEGRLVLAFAGIARPAKFYATLALAGAQLAGRRDFPDHHSFTAGELRSLDRDAAALRAELVTTPKDAVRLPPELRRRVLVAGVTLVWQDPSLIEALLDTLL